MRFVSLIIGTIVLGISALRMFRARWSRQNAADVSPRSEPQPHNEPPQAEQSGSHPSESLEPHSIECLHTAIPTITPAEENARSFSVAVADEERKGPLPESASNLSAAPVPEIATASASASILADETVQGAIEGHRATP